MSPHRLLDACLWFIAALWFIQFITDFTREHRRWRRIRQLGPPSKDCDRVGDYEVHMSAFTRRQGD